MLPSGRNDCGGLKRSLAQSCLPEGEHRLDDASRRYRRILLVMADIDVILKQRFYAQKSGAKKRGIPFRFTYKSWSQWWEKQLGPEWKTLRGSNGKDYCMARHGDKGPYAIDNVKCITRIENTKEGSHCGGEEHPSAKLNWEKVDYIRKSTLSQRRLAKLFKVNHSTIKDILKHKTWKVGVPDRA